MTDDIDRKAFYDAIVAADAAIVPDKDNGPATFLGVDPDNLPDFMQQLLDANLAHFRRILTEVDTDPPSAMSRWRLDRIDLVAGPNPMGILPPAEGLLRLYELPDGTWGDVGISEDDS